MHITAVAISFYSVFFFVCTSLFSCTRFFYAIVFTSLLAAVTQLTDVKLQESQHVA